MHSDLSTYPIIFFFFNLHIFTPLVSRAYQDLGEALYGSSLGFLGDPENPSPSFDQITITMF
jgi:hypothetical protein